MINLIPRLWRNFKNQPDIWFFFGFLLTFTLSIRKILFYFPIQGIFNEYSVTYIYLSDIFLILTLISWFISILCNNLSSLSMFKLWISSALHKLYIFLPLFLVFLSFLSIIWSQNVSIATFRSIKLLEFYLLDIYIIFRIVPRLPDRKLFHVEQSTITSTATSDVPRGTISEKEQKSETNCSTWNNFGRVEQFWLFFNIIIFSGLIQAIIGIIQFFLQKSIGLFWLQESLISPDILGVAKVILNGEKYIRAYGLMPHPNILGGFLLFSIIITLLYRKLFHACPTENCSTPARQKIVPRLPDRKLFHVEQSTIINTTTSKNVPRGTILGGWNNINNTYIFRLILAVKILALILTFSKSAIIGILIALIYIIVPRLPETRMFHVEHSWAGGTIKHLKLTILSGLIILTSAFIIIKPDLDSLFVNSLNERLFYLNVPRGTFISDPILGVGVGQSVLSMQKYFPQKLEFWQYQPVHNVFLLIFSELGLIGLGLFIWWLWKLFHACPTENCSTPACQKIVPRLPAGEAGGTILGGWNNFGRVEQFENSQEGIEENNKYILHNDNTYLSSTIFSCYFQGILLGLIFIMLFDHYLWDIQQGSLLFWLIAGFVAGMRRK